MTMRSAHRKAKRIMDSEKSIILFLLLVLAALTIYKFNLSPTGEMSYFMTATGVNTSIDLSYSPEEPRVLQKMEVKAVVKSERRENFLEIVVTENGRTNKYQEYQFPLEGGGNTFIFDYAPTSINKQTIVANLYNYNKTVLYDSKMIDFKAESDIGPFDIEVNPLTNFVPKGKELPLTVKMKNFGLKGTDVNLIIFIDCLYKADIEQSSVIFINTSAELEKDYLLPTCDEVDQHRIRASVIVYGAEYVSASTQYYEKENLASLDFLVPNIIATVERSTHKLNILFNNKNGIDAKNIKPIVFGIPSSWFTITPSFIPEIKPDDFSVAIIDFNIPKNSRGSYMLMVGASGDNLFSQKIVELKVDGAAAAAKTVESADLKSIIIISAMLAIGILIFFIWKKRK